MDIERVWRAIVKLIIFERPHDWLLLCGEKCLALDCAHFIFRCTAVILEYVIALLLRLAVCINSIGFVLLLLLYLLFVIFVLRGKLEFIQFEIEIGSLVVNVSASAVFGYLLLNESIFFCSPIRIHFVVCMARYLSCGSFISLRKWFVCVERHFTLRTFFF